jgi:uroporphyrin-3 C-methyltransferase
MSETQNIAAEKTEAPATPAQPASPERQHKPLNLALILALGALALSGWQLFSTQQELKSVRQELSRRHPDATLKSLTDQLHATEGRLTLAEARLSESSAQFATINNMYQDLTKVRSDWLLSEVGHALALSSQELQLVGNVPSAISALEVVNHRLAEFDRPELIGVKKALAHDIETLRALPYLDTIGLSAKLDSLTQLIDTLPLAIDVQRQQVKLATPATNSPFWSQLIRDISQSLGEMVRIRRIDKPETVLLSPEQSFQLRENIKLRLLDARVALLQHNAAPYNADINAVQNYVTRYFDQKASATQQWLAHLSELKAAPLNNALPDLSNSLKAVNSAEANKPGE